MNPSTWSSLVLISLVACVPSTSGPAAEEAPSFIEDDGTVKQAGPGTPMPSNIGLPDDLVRMRCRVSTEGRIFGCTRLSGPRVVEDRLTEALKRARVEPTMQDGTPVESIRTFAFRIAFVMR